MSQRRVLLISSNQPSASGVGGLYLLECCRQYPSDRIACIHFSSAPTPEPWSADLSEVCREIHHWPYDRSRRPTSGRVGALVAYADQWVTRCFRQGCAIRRTWALVQAFEPDVIWAVLDTPLMYRLPRQIARRLGIPLVTTVWDPPEAVCGELGWDRWSTLRAKRDFAASVRQSQRCGVVSENMQAEYTQRFGTPCVLLRHAVRRSHVVARAQQSRPERSFRIGFCGSVYSRVEWDALMAALDSIQWVLDGREVEVWTFCKRILLGAPGRANVRFFGWRGTDEMLPMLAQVDVGYLPYWFDNNRRESVRLCFPTKLGTYLACDLPVLFHGPADSSVAAFLRAHAVGVTCDSNEPTRLVGCLRRLSSDEETLLKMKESRDSVLDTILNLELFQQKFHELMAP